MRLEKRGLELCCSLKLGCICNRSQLYEIIKVRKTKVKYFDRNFNDQWILCILWIFFKCTKRISIFNIYSDRLTP